MTPEQTNLSRPFFDSVKSGDIEAVNEMIKRIDVSGLISDTQSFHQNSLYSAAQIKNEDLAIRMVGVLTAAGVVIAHSVDGLKQTPLYYCVREGHARLIKVFIDGGCNVNHLDIYGQNPIYYSVSTGNVPITRLLVSCGADPDVVDLNGQTPAYYAVKSGHFEMVEYLISLKINLQAVDLRSKTLSHWAR